MGCIFLFKLLFCKIQCYISTFSHLLRHIIVFKQSKAFWLNKSFFAPLKLALNIIPCCNLLSWSSRQRIIQHAILVVSLAMTWPLNVLILTAVLSSTGQDGNALSHYSGRLRHDTSSFILINLLSLLLFSHMRSLFFVSLFCSEQ